MANTSPTTESFRLRPLPPIPTSASSSPSSTTASSTFPETSVSTLPSTHYSTTYDTSDRNSISTFTSVGTSLPRYSTIDFLDLGSSLDQVDHWSEVDERSVASMPPTNQPPEYARNEDLTPPRRPLPGCPKPHFVLHKFHGGRDSNKIGLIKCKQTAQQRVTLKLLSRSATPGSKAKLPRFIGGDTLRGSVDLHIDTPLTVHSIKLILKAKVQVAEGCITAASPIAKDHVFLDQSYTIYSKKVGDPRWNGQCNLSRNKELNGTMHGSYSFPFSLPLPEHVEWSDKRQDSRDGSTIPVLSYGPPPSFREKNMSSAVVYEFGLVFTYGALRSKNRIFSEIVFVSKQVSPPASKKRQAAYRDGALLPGPAADPKGWHAQGPIVISGCYQRRPVEASCALYLAAPLSYTRGTIIPCYATFTGLDFAFLDVLATPHTINLRLSRYIRHSAPNKGKGKEVENIQSLGRLRATYISKAVWWRPAKMDTPPDPKERHIEGEIHLPKNMIPSCNYPLFNIEYTLELFHLNLDSFIPTSKLNTKRGCPNADSDDEDDDEPLLKTIVDITSFHEHGPVPLAFTVPTFEEETRAHAMQEKMDLEYIPWAPSGCSTVQHPPVAAQ
ncbi:hypothetical protein P691DRAFT_777965 [Macrolepiota fuliginosa MF-IS2]|uniref:Arrestin-like N-terminal domain-containing protein n=1 Tax=Macrolepiota fuliginosa MF-IS2 TaxID=1400762 RepID=A0A9P6BY87_9AGAR|nr:hypothetical protein P691DRAFT_777965 [Macrolepiota fuliginosa MF-IS2]